MTSLLNIRVIGEDISYDFLSDGNYMELNGEKYPLGTFPLKVPVGPANIKIYSPALDCLNQLNYEFLNTQMLMLELTVNSSRNITDVNVWSANLKDLTHDNLAAVANYMEIADKYESKFAPWRANHRADSAPISKPISEPSPPFDPTPAPCNFTRQKKGGKLIVWGLVVLIFFLCGAIACHYGAIEIDPTPLGDSIQFSNLKIYCCGAGLGLIMFIAGIIRRIFSK